MRFSASGLKSLKQCPRQFAFKYLAKLPRGATPEAFAFGSRCHKIAEDWLRDHKTPDSTTYEGRLFLSGVQHLPSPKTVEVERKFEWTDPDGNDWIAFLDFCDLATGLIGDHKFQVQPKKWGLSTDTLPDDPAAIVYAIALIREGAKAGKYLWVYYDKSTKSRPDAYAVEVGWTEESVKARHEKQIVPLLKRAKEMENQLAGSGSTPLEFAQLIDNDPNACGGCGRNCDFAEHCNIWNTKPTERSNDMGRFDSLFGDKSDGQTNVQTNFVSPELAAKLGVQEPKAEPKSVETPIQTTLAKHVEPKAEATSVESKFAELSARLKNVSGVNPPEAEQAIEETAKEVLGIPEPAKEVAPKATRGKKKAETVESVEGVDLERLASLVAKKICEAALLQL